MHNNIKNWVPFIYSCYELPFFIKQHIVSYTFIIIIFFSNFIRFYFVFILFLCTHFRFCLYMYHQDCLSSFFHSTGLEWIWFIKILNGVSFSCVFMIIMTCFFFSRIVHWRVCHKEVLWRRINMILVAITKGSS